MKIKLLLRAFLTLFLKKKHTSSDLCLAYTLVLRVSKGYTPNIRDDSKIKRENKSVLFLSTYFQYFLSDQCRFYTSYFSV